MIHFEKVEQLFGKSLVARGRANKGDNSIRQRGRNDIVLDVYFCLNLPFEKGNEEKGVE